MGNILFDIRNLKKSYGKNTPALEGVSFQIKEGELTLILGSSGSGKSTLLNLLGGIDKVSEGSILFKGRDITHFNHKELVEYRRNQIAFIYQNFNLIEDLSAKENIALQSAIVQNALPIEKALDEVGLAEKGSRYPKELSGGERQRVSIARALIKPNAVLLCDEITGALDYATGKKILSLIEKLVVEEKRSVIFVTHTREIAKMADTVVYLRDGKIEEIIHNKDKKKASEIEW